MVTQTKPSMNPRMTGVGIKAATQPMRSAPNSRKKAPIKIARAEVSVLNSAVPWAAAAPVFQFQYHQADDRDGDEELPTTDLKLARLRANGSTATIFP